MKKTINLSKDQLKNCINQAEATLHLEHVNEREYRYENENLRDGWIWRETPINHPELGLIGTIIHQQAFEYDTRYPFQTPKIYETDTVEGTTHIRPEDGFKVKLTDLIEPEFEDQYGQLGIDGHNLYQWLREENFKSVDLDLDLCEVQSLFNG